MTLIANSVEEAPSRGYIACGCDHPLCLGYKWPKGRDELAQRGASYRARLRKERRAAKA